jgi:hypothetical protein
MDTLEKARAAGFVVLLDGRIGRETYHTITGSLSALERFEALCLASPVLMRGREEAGGVAARREGAVVNNAAGIGGSTVSPRQCVD